MAKNVVRRPKPMRFSRAVLCFLSQRCSIAVNAVNVSGYDRWHLFSFSACFDHDDSGQEAKRWSFIWVWHKILG